MDRRRHRILDALFKALECSGTPVTENASRVIHVNLGGEAVEIRLREKLRQLRRPLTDDEKRWARNRERGWIQELVGSGRLVFEIRSWMPKPFKRDWLESDERPMEALLGDIVTTLLAAAPRIEARRMRRADEQREREKAAARRREAERIKRIDDNRWALFLELATEWEDAQRAQAYLGALLEDGNADDGETGRLQDWVANRVERVSPKRRGTGDVLAALDAINEWH